MSKTKYCNTVVKTVVAYRTCRVCKWWQRNRPGQAVRTHRCVQNRKGSAKMMESVTGVAGVKQLADDGTPVEFIEGDGDNTLIIRLKHDHDIDMKKHFDKNHVVKNIGKYLYSLAIEKGVKMSKTVICKCVFATSSPRMEANLKAPVPHQFGDHTLCKATFCGFMRNTGEVYRHRSLPYKSSLKNPLRSRLEALFVPIIASAAQYIDLGCSQQCEHANREVSLRSPKTQTALDFQVHATSGFINEGRGYITQAFYSDIYIVSVYVSVLDLLVIYLRNYFITYIK